MSMESAALMAQGPSLIAWAKNHGLMSEKPRAVVTAKVDHLARESLSTLVRVEIRDGEWVATVDGLHRSGRDAEMAVRRIALVILQRQKRRLNLPGVLQDDDSLEVEPVSHGMWKASWRHGR